MKNNVIVGSSIAALVSTLEIGKKGNQITLITHRGDFGNHFSGINVNNNHYDIGMSVIEFISTNSQIEPDIVSYNQNIRNDVGRFFNLLDKYVREIHPVEKIIHPKSFFRGNLFDDFLLSNSFDIFKSFSINEKHQIQDELNNRSKNNIYHASNKISLQHIHTSLNYKTTSLYNHGDFIHNNILEPYLNKVTGLKSEEIVSSFHRRFWTPLYYPETIIKALYGQIVSFGNTEFHYPFQAGFNCFSTSLLKKIKTTSTIKIVDDQVIDIDYNNKSIKLKSKENLEFNKIGWTASLSECQRLLKIDSIKDEYIVRTGLTFDFLILDNYKILKDFSIVFVIDKNLPCYRITNQSKCSNFNSKNSKIVVEYNNNFLFNSNIISNEDIHLASITSLIKMGLIASNDAIKASEVLRFPNILSIPSRHSEEITNKNISLINDNFPDISLFGESSGIASRSFGDNFIQGLKYAALYIN